MRTRTTALLAVLPIAVLASCGSAVDGTARAGTPVPAGLERFYAQELTWGSCAGTESDPAQAEILAGPGIECTSVEVPLDYSKPDGRTAEIALLRRATADPDQRIGSLLLNPGGPGETGRDFAAMVSEGSEGTGLGDHFDWVGFDPRGLGASTPAVRCLTDEERKTDPLDEELEAPVSDTEAATRVYQEFVQRCVDRVGVDVLANIGTVDVARDLDVIRAALGDPELTYLGFSYGTSIGTEYAEQFPDNVRALVLDGAIDPAVPALDETVDQMRSFQQAFTAFVAECVQHEECWTTNPATADADFQRMVGPLQGLPRQVGDRQLSYGDAVTATLSLLYDPSTRPDLNAALVEFAAGGGGQLLEAADEYLRRDQAGSSSAEEFAVAIDCVDEERVTDPAVMRDADRRFREAAPFLDDGSPLSADLGVCAHWPVPPTSTAGVPDVDGLRPTLVISTVGDPATPYADGVALARELGARLLTYEGKQHTIALEDNDCVNAAVEEYLVDLTLPAEGTRCPE